MPKKLAKSKPALPPEPLGERIRRLRESKGLTPGQLALAIGSPTGRQIVHAWESGRSEPVSRWIVPLADALDVSLDELLR